MIWVDHFENSSFRLLGGPRDGVTQIHIIRVLRTVTACVIPTLARLKVSGIAMSGQRLKQYILRDFDGVYSSIATLLGCND
jgi:hypothetical protein